MKNEFKGVITALITPFKNGEVDFLSLQKLIEYQIQGEVDGFVINGTTGESPTLTASEVKEIFIFIRKIVGQSKTLILGTGSNSTITTIKNNELAAECQADAALVVVPYYNKPPQRGLVEHFKIVAEKSKTPILLYNVPGRTITNLSLESVIELSKVKNIVGIKEASGDISFDLKLKNLVNSNFRLLSGDDGTYVDFLKLGGHGIISVMSNIIPFETQRWTKQVQSGILEEAENNFRIYKKFIDSIYIEANPIPVKWMLFKKGIISSPELRLPLTALDTKFIEDVEKTMREIKII